MKRNHPRHMAATMIIIGALGAASMASAQYVWIDERGVKQYSDMPPPTTVPTSRILKQPGGITDATPTTDGTSAAASQATATEMSTAEKNVEFRKRKTEQVEKEKKAADEARLGAEKARNCERTREYLRALESGERLTRTDRTGERSYLSDDERQQETKETRRILQDCK